MPHSKVQNQLIAVGRREVFSKTNPARQHGKRDAQGQRPTTSKALILRNGKYGSQGTGELMYMGRMSGREKLDLLAEDLVEQSKKAILSPLRMEKCLKMAESQLDVYIDDITNLKDSDTFLRCIQNELKANEESDRQEPRKSPAHVGKLVATRIHNSYMLASAWKIVSETLNDLAIDGLTDQNAQRKLREDPDIRERYLFLWDMLETLVKMHQTRFSVLATKTGHYSKYFKLKPTESSDPSEAEYIFDWSELRKAANSFLDSIIIELCFPQGTYPRAILYRILHDAIDESPNQAKRFPQALWDAVGDLAISVELQELLEAPLFGPEGEKWKKERREKPEEFECWVDAQIFSEKASNMFNTFKDLIYPLDKTTNQPLLDRMWRQINQNYISVSGLDIDSLWQLEDTFNRKPQWTGGASNNFDDDSDDEGFSNSNSVIVRKSDKQKVLAIANGGDSSDTSMPGLQSVSNSDDDDEYEDSDASYDSDVNGESSDDDDGYDTEEEEEIRDQLRAAMDAAHESAWLEAEPNVPQDIDILKSEDFKGNPFLKLLGSLRGRMFTSSPKLKTETRKEPRPSARGAFRATPTGVPKAVPIGKPSAPPTAASSSSNTAPGTPPKSQKATVEEVEDEDNIKSSAQKKKKKKSKKKKAAASPEHPPSPPSPTQSVKSGNEEKTPSISSRGSSQPVLNSLVSPSFTASMVSLGLGETKTAQSAHSYLQKENLIKSDQKVKSRPDHASLFSNEDEKKKGIFSKKLSSKSKEENTEETKTSWTARLKKTTNLMHQLLRPSSEQKKARSPMKWENFLKLMREMGFHYDPSTAGSSVRFDPPNKSDKPITFHKPHPDSTLQPFHLHDFAKRLKKAYGWNEEDLMKLDGDNY